MGFLKLTFFFIIILAFTFGCRTSTVPYTLEQEKLTSVSLIHMNDTHSHLMGDPFELKLDGQNTQVILGGFAKAATKIKELRRQNENSLVLHAGDALSGTLFYTLFKGTADAEMLNESGFDVFTIGNHEFDDGDDTLAAFLKQLKMPIVNTNITVPPGNPISRLFSPYIIHEINDQKIGIIGLVVVDKTKKSSNPGYDITFTNEINSVQKSVNSLTSQGVNKIILLSHYGYKNELKLASQVDGIDIIIGGDSHTLLGDFSPFGVATSGPYPTKTTSTTGKPVCIVQAWQYAYAVGHLKVLFNEKGVVSSCKGQTTLLLADSFKRNNHLKKLYEVKGTNLEKIYQEIDQSNLVEIVKDDQHVAAVLKQFSSQVNIMKNKQIGVAKENIHHLRIPATTYNGISLPLGSNIAPLVAKSFYELSHRADAAIINAGGVRMGISPGDITVDTAYRLLPFSNTLIEINMTGTDIKSVLEGAIDNTVEHHSSGAFPYAYGLRYNIDMTQRKGVRVSDIDIKDRHSGRWDKLDFSKEYIITTISYLAEGKDGYDTFKTVQDTREKGVDTYFDYAMSFVEYVKSENTKGKPITQLPAEEHPIKQYTAAIQ